MLIVVLHCLFASQQSWARKQKNYFCLRNRLPHTQKGKRSRTLNCSTFNLNAHANTYNNPIHLSHFITNDNSQRQRQQRTKRHMKFLSPTNNEMKKRENLFDEISAGMNVCDAYVAYTNKNGKLMNRWRAEQSRREKKRCKTSWFSFERLPVEEKAHTSTLQTRWRMERTADFSRFLFAAKDKIYVTFRLEIPIWIFDFDVRSSYECRKVAKERETSLRALQRAWIIWREKLCMWTLSAVM